MRHHFANKVLPSQSYGLSSSHVWMWELDQPWKDWAPKNWCFQPMVLKKTLESSLDIKEIKPVLPKGNQAWIFIGRSEAEAESPIIWPPDVKSWLTEKDPDIDKERGQEEKGATEDQMIRFHHWLSGNEFDQPQRLWRSGKPDMLQPMGWQRVGHDWTTTKI